MMPTSIAYQDLRGITRSGTIRLNQYHNRDLLIKLLKVYYLSRNNQKYWRKLIQNKYPELLRNKSLWRPSIKELLNLTSPLKYYNECYPNKQTNILYYGLQRILVERLSLKKAHKYCRNHDVRYNITYNHAYQHHCGFNKNSIRLNSFNREVIIGTTHELMKINRQIIHNDPKEVSSTMYESCMILLELQEKTRHRKRFIYPTKQEANRLRKCFGLCLSAGIQADWQGHPNLQGTLHLEAAFMALNRMYLSKISGPYLKKLERHLLKHISRRKSSELVSIL